MSGRYGLQIRAATSADAPGLAALMLACGDTNARTDWAARLDALARSSATVLLALEWGPPSGVVVWQRVRTILSDHPVAQITTLLVGPQERRRGIGRQLLKAAAQSARAAGCDALQLVVGWPDETLRAFCHATGFVESDSLFARPLRKKSEGGAPSGRA